MAGGAPSPPPESEPGDSAEGSFFDVPTPLEFTWEQTSEDPPESRPSAVGLSGPPGSELDDELVRARAFMKEVVKVSGKARDRSGWVTATVDHGLNIVDLSVADRPGSGARTLGPAMSEAISSAQKASQSSQEALRAEFHPELPADLGSEQPGTSNRPGEHLFTPEDHAEPRKVRQVLAEALEQWHTSNISLHEHRTRTFTRQIAHGSGTVALRGDLGDPRVEFTSTALEGSTPSRLAHHVVEALAALRDDIAEAEQRILSGISIGDGTLLSVREGTEPGEDAPARR